MRLDAGLLILRAGVGVCTVLVVALPQAQGSGVPAGVPGRAGWILFLAVATLGVVVGRYARVAAAAASAAWLAAAAGGLASGQPWFVLPVRGAEFAFAHAALALSGPGRFTLGPRRGAGSAPTGDRARLPSTGTAARFLAVILVCGPVLWATLDPTVLKTVEATGPHDEHGMAFRMLSLFPATVAAGSAFAQTPSVRFLIRDVRVFDGHMGGEDGLRQALVLGVTTVLDMFTTQDRLKMMMGIRSRRPARHGRRTHSWHRGETPPPR